MILNARPYSLCQEYSSAENSLPPGSSRFLTHTCRQGCCSAYHHGHLSRHLCDCRPRSVQCTASSTLHRAPVCSAQFGLLSKLVSYKVSQLSCPNSCQRATPFLSGKRAILSHGVEEDFVEKSAFVLPQTTCVKPLENSLTASVFTFVVVEGFFSLLLRSSRIVFLCKTMGCFSQFLFPHNDHSIFFFFPEQCSGPSALICGQQICSLCKKSVPCILKTKSHFVYFLGREIWKKNSIGFLYSIILPCNSTQF